MATAKSAVGKIGMFLMNPMVRKLDKIEEHGDTHATYGGITIKTMILLAFTLVGVMVFFFTSPMIPTSYVERIEGFDINMIQGAIAIGALLVACIFPLIAFKFVGASMVLGALYSIAQGYALTFLFHIPGPQFVYPGMIALGLTIAVVLVMLLLYRMGIVRVHRKFVSIVSTLFVMSLLVSAGVFIMGQIPATKEYAEFVMGNSVIAIVCGVIGVIIASLFLLVDFEVIRHCVEDKLPQKYEWLAAFALSFAVIELYIKILNLVAKLISKKNT